MNFSKNSGDPVDREAEKRRFDRVANHFLVRACKAELTDDVERKVAGIVHDISEGGLSFITDQEYVPGHVLELEIEMTGLEPPADKGRGLLNAAVVVTQGTVLRKALFEFGPNIIAVSFDQLDPSDRQLITQAISLLERNNT